MFPWSCQILQFFQLSLIVLLVTFRRLLRIVNVPIDERRDGFLLWIQKNFNFLLYGKSFFFIWDKCWLQFRFNFIIRFMFHQFSMGVESAPGHRCPSGFCDVCVNWNWSENGRHTHSTRNVLYEYALLCAVSCCINLRTVSRNDRIGTVSPQYDSACESIEPFCWWIFCHINCTGISSHQNEWSDGFWESSELTNIFRTRHIYNVAHVHSPTARGFPNIFYPNTINLERKTQITAKFGHNEHEHMTLLTTFDANEVLPSFTSFMISTIVSLHCLDVSEWFIAHLAR